MGGSGIEPFIALLQGGAGGGFYQDMLDYFYYAQLRSQGLNTTGPRKITGFISVEEVIPLMCALGYYPSKEGIKDIENEVKFAHQAQRGIYKDKVEQALFDASLLCFLLPIPTLNLYDFVVLSFL